MTPAASAAAASPARSRPSHPSPRRASHRATAPGAATPRDAATRARPGTGGRDMRVAVGIGRAARHGGPVCFAAGTVASMVIVSVVVLLAAAEAYAAFRRAQYHPATLLGLVACSRC